MQNLQIMRASVTALWPGPELADSARRAASPRRDDASCGLDSSVAAQLELLDRINLAAAVLRREERVVQLNRQCERLLGASLTLQGGRLVARDRSSNERLRKAIAAVFSFRGNASHAHAECGLIMREPQSPILFRVLPLGRSPFDGKPPYALLMFSSPQLQSAVDPGLLSRALDLTPAQARVARQLATGASLDTAAARLGIKKETARNHLKQIFFRTGTCRQGQLIALLSAFWLAAQEEGQDASEMRAASAAQ